MDIKCRSCSVAVKLRLVGLALVGLLSSCNTTQPGDDFPSLLVTNQCGSGVRVQTLSARGSIELDAPLASDETRELSRAVTTSVVRIRVIALSDDTAHVEFEALPGDVELSDGRCPP